MWRSMLELLRCTWEHAGQLREGIGEGGRRKEGWSGRDTEAQLFSAGQLQEARMREEEGVKRRDGRERGRGRGRKRGRGGGSMS